MSTYKPAKNAQEQIEYLKANKRRLCHNKWLILTRNSV